MLRAACCVKTCCVMRQVNAQTYESRSTNHESRIMQHVSRITLAPPIDHLFGDIVVLEGDIDGQLLLVAAVAMHNPEMPGAGFIGGGAIAQEDNLATVWAPGGGDIAGHLVDQCGGRAG